MKFIGVDKEWLSINLYNILATIGGIADAREDHPSQNIRNIRADFPLG